MAFIASSGLVLTGVPVQARPPMEPCVLGRLDQLQTAVETASETLHNIVTGLRIKRHAVRSVLRGSVSEIEGLLVRPDLDFQEKDLGNLRKLAGFLEDPANGMKPYGKKLTQKISRLERLLRGEVDGVLFTSGGRKDLEGLDAVARKHLLTATLPKLVKNPALGSMKEGRIPRQYRFLHFTGSSGTTYVVGYEIKPKGIIEVHIVGPHENVYDRFIRRMGR